MPKKILSLFLFCALFFTACGSRTPSPNTAQKIIERHFNDYTKKYPDSPVGNQKVRSVEIVKIEELQKDLAIAVARVVFQDQKQIKIQMNFLKKPPLGWRKQGWELLPNP